MAGAGLTSVRWVVARAAGGALAVSRSGQVGEGVTEAHSSFPPALLRQAIPAVLTGQVTARDQAVEVGPDQLDLGDQEAG